MTRNILFFRVIDTRVMVFTSTLLIVGLLTATFIIYINRTKVQISISDAGFCPEWGRDFLCVGS